MWESASVGEWESGRVGEWKRESTGGRRGTGSPSTPRLRLPRSARLGNCAPTTGPSIVEDFGNSVFDDFDSFGYFEYFLTTFGDKYPQNGSKHDPYFSKRPLG